MPLSRRSAAARGVTIGFYGTGEIERETSSRLVEDYINENAKDTDAVRFLLPVISDEWTDALADVTDMADVGKIPYEVFVSPADSKVKTLSDVITTAAKAHRVEDPLVGLRTTLTDAPGAALFILWDQDRSEAMEIALTPFIEAGVKVFELTDGLVEMDFRPDPADETGEPEDEPVEEPEEPAEEPVGDDEPYSREELQGMSLADLKAIGAQMGLPPKRATALMIESILDAQGVVEETAEEAVEEDTVLEKAEAILEEAVEVATAVGFADLEALAEINGVFLSGLQGIFTEFLGEFTQVLQSANAAVAEEAPEPSVEPSEAPKPRRLSAVASTPTPSSSGGRRGRLR